MPESRPRRLLSALAVVLMFAATMVGLGMPAEAASGLRISVLSNRADLISAGDALVAVTLPRGVRPSTVRVTAGKRDVTRAFAARPNGKYEGLVTGLPLGRVVLRATAGRYVDDIVVTNHPNGGPVFSGPQIQPWVCQQTALDKKCNQPAEYTYLYKSTNPTKPGLQPYDPENPPSDVATTTTDHGKSVPFIVRQELGYQDRDQYKILQLFQPGKSWQAWAPQPQWNHKVLITHGGGCGYGHTSDEAPLADFSGTFPDNPAQQNSYVTALSRGFAVLSTALDNLGHNCNLLTQAESLVMAKERLVEQYGPIRYTIGTGCSGGSIVQNQVANAYPGVYQGLITTCSYPDAVTTLAQFADLHLMRLYFEDPSKWEPGVVWTPTQMAAVEGHLAHLNAITSDELFFAPLSNPSEGCAGVKDDQVYDAESNPDGVRCFLFDYMINIFGHRPKSKWTPQEREAGRGFAGIPLGNRGIPYGLKVLEQGQITPAQFADLNAKIGGLTIDAKPQPERAAGDVFALKRAYRSGAINEATNLSQVAIINHGGADPGAAHDYGHAYWTRSRLERVQGHARNMVMWFGQAPLIGDPGWANEALLAIDKWLAAVEADHSSRPLARKIVADRPADLQDRCSNLPGFEEIDVPGVGKVCEDPTLQTRLSTPRGVAGGPVQNDVNDCRLQPLRRTSFYPTAFSDADWKGLKKTFPQGVCDYGEPAIGQRKTLTWLSYQQCDGDVLYGGRPLGSAPARSGGAWTSTSFGSWVGVPEKRSFVLGGCPTAGPSRTAQATAAGDQSAGAGTAADGARTAGAHTSATAPTAADSPQVRPASSQVTPLLGVAGILLAAAAVGGWLGRRQRLQR